MQMVAHILINATVIPSGKRLVYAMIYRIFFHNLYGEVAISRNKFCLADDDTAEWGPLEDCIKYRNESLIIFLLVQ